MPRQARSADRTCPGIGSPHAIGGMDDRAAKARAHTERVANVLTRISTHGAGVPNGVPRLAFDGKQRHFRDAELRIANAEINIGKPIRLGHANYDHREPQSHS